MKQRVLVLLLLAVFVAAFAANGAATVSAQGPTPIKWKLVNPAGVPVIKPSEMAARITTLEGKTVALYWNGKHNGNNFLNRVAEILTEKVKGVKIVKIYETNPDTANISGTPEKSKAKADIIAKFKPDIVIASQAD